jgi:hypothetical protein
MAIQIGNNLLNISGRTRATHDGNGSNTAIRRFSENNYYVGMTANNYWTEAYIERHIVEKNRVLVETSNFGYGIAFPVICKPNETYSFSYEGEHATYAVGFYTANGEFISYAEEHNINRGITTPENCYWVVICLKNKNPNQDSVATFTNIMFNKGATALPYEPYKPSSYSIFMKGSNNLFKLKGRTQAPYDSSAGGNTSIRNFSEDLYYLGMTANNYWYFWNIGSATVEENKIQVVPKNGGYGVVFPIKCKPNTKYALSYVGVNGNIRIGYYNEKGEWLASTEDNITTTFNFTTPDNCYWFTICFIAKDLTKNAIYACVMVNEGEVALPYSPFGMTKVKAIVKSNNLLLSIKSSSAMGFTAQKNNDGSITLFGERTGSGFPQFYIFDIEKLKASVKTGETYSFSPNALDIYLTFAIKTQSGTIKYIDGWKTKTITLAEGETIDDCWLQIHGNINSLDKKTVYPMLNKGSIVLPYEPYLKKATMLVL